jgi:hypothetical protein
LLRKAGGYNGSRGGERVALAISILLLAGGAILVWGVSAEVGGLDIDVVGWILMVTGLVGAAFALTTYARGRTVRATRRDYLEP